MRVPPMAPTIKNLWLSQLDNLLQSEMPKNNDSLAIAANYHFKNPGKAFRAQLAISSGTALNLDNKDNIHWAAACELLHNASLIHDDISDASTHRRGQKSINEFFGSDMALCLGDWMVAKAFELAARNTQQGGQLTALLAQAMQETCSGQISDTSQRQCADLGEWQKIAAGKTAPLLIAPIKGAAIAAGIINTYENSDWLNDLDRLVSFSDDLQIYKLTKFIKTNQATCINLRPAVKKGQKVKKGDFLTEGYATKDGEVALGRNLQVAFMPWKGYNFEDAIVISERVVREDLFT